ncbi:MAG: type II secretion system F family protein [Alphaproteobacteria bacterium]|nr:type II secretion system F family protein [Alphaproteobacteria bacterium]
MLMIIVFILAGLVGAGIAAFVVQQSKAKRRERALSVISGRAADKKEEKKEGEAEGPAKPKAVSASEIAKKLKKMAKEQENEHDTQSVAALLVQSGLNCSPFKFWVISMTLATIFSAIIAAIGVSDVVAGLLVFAAYFGAPRFFLRFKVARRQRAFLTDFADALEAMIRLIKAGMPVTEAIAMVGREFTGPMGEEMSRIYDAQKVGTPLAEAVRKMIPRMPIAEVQMFATAIAVQVQTGSSLSEVLSNLSGVIRARARLKRKVQALSAEAKASAMIIGCLPLLVATALYLVNPKYISLLFTDSTGKMLLFGAITWMSFGVLMMRQMINFKV